MNENTAGQGGVKGVRVEAAILKESQGIVLNLRIKNNAGRPLSDFMSQLKPNYFGLTIDKFPNITINNGETKDVKLGVGKSGNKDANIPKPPLMVTAGFKTNIDVFYFNIPCMFHVLLVR